MNRFAARVVFVRDLTSFLLLLYAIVGSSTTQNVYPSAFTSASQNVETAQLTQFLLLTSVDGNPACSVSTPPYKSYTVDRIISCAYDCKTLQRQTSNSNACAGFNYYDFEHNRTCQLFTSSQRLYFIEEQVSCRYFSNVEIVGRKFAPTVCPSSFAYDDDVKGCYKGVRLNFDWNTAAQYCQTLVPGGHLVFINGSQETAAMSPLMNDTSGCQQTGYSGGTSLFTWWIGLQYFDPLVDTPPFYWKLDTKTVAAPISYTNWDFTQPDNCGQNEHCADLLPSLKWNDVLCTITMCFICELDI